MKKIRNIARAICEADGCSFRFGLGMSDDYAEFRDIMTFNEFDADNDCDAFADFKVERVNDNQFEVTTMRTRNEDALRNIYWFPEVNCSDTINENDFVLWLMIVFKQVDFFDYGNCIQKQK